MYTPTATYRIQLCHGFNFSQLSDILPYLWELGISSTAAHIGFIRANQDLRLLILAPLPSTREEPRLSGIPGIQGRWKNVLTGQELGLGDSIDTLLLFKSFPVAALLSQNH